MTKQDVIDAAAAYGSRFQNWMGFQIDWEAVYSHGQIVTENVPGDNGGRTFCGIDEASSPAFFHNPITPDAVCEVYFSDYWQKVGSLPFPVKEVAANFAVNMGLRAAAKMLQAALNQAAAQRFISALGHGLPDFFGQTYIAVDGQIGFATQDAAAKSNPHAVAEIINDEADERYRSIVRCSPGKRKFLAGWLNRDVALEKWWHRLPAQTETLPANPFIKNGTFIAG